MRESIVDLLWDKVEPVLYISKDQFVDSLEGWEIEPLVVEGEIAFVILTRGPEFHFDSLRTGHKIPLSRIRETIERLIATHGYAETRTPREDFKQRRVNVLFGCERVGEDEYDIHYRLEKIGRRICR